MNKHETTFICDNHGHRVEVKCEDETADDIVRAFAHFMLGSGFYPISLARAFAEIAEEYAEYEKEDKHCHKSCFACASKEDDDNEDAFFTGY